MNITSITFVINESLLPDWLKGERSREDLNFVLDQMCKRLFPELNAR